MLRRSDVSLPRRMLTGAIFTAHVRERRLWTPDTCGSSDPGVLTPEQVLYRAPPIIRWAVSQIRDVRDDGHTMIPKGKRGIQTESWNCNEQSKAKTMTMTMTKIMTKIMNRFRLREKETLQSRKRCRPAQDPCRCSARSPGRTREKNQGSDAVRL